MKNQPHHPIVDYEGDTFYFLDALLFASSTFIKRNGPALRRYPVSWQEHQPYNIQPDLLAWKARIIRGILRRTDSKGYEGFSSTSVRVVEFQGNSCRRLFFTAPMVKMRARLCEPNLRTVSRSEILYMYEHRTFASHCSTQWRLLLYYDGVVLL